MAVVAHNGSFTRHASRNGNAKTKVGHGRAPRLLSGLHWEGRGRGLGCGPRVWAAADVQLAAWIAVVARELHPWEPHTLELHTWLKCMRRLARGPREAWVFQPRSWRFGAPLPRPC